MSEKNLQRLRRARRGRAKIRELGVHRLTVHRTPRHTYAQVLAPGGAETIVAASTVEKALRGKLKSGGGNSEAAAVIGAAIAERAKKAGIDTVAFDRSGYKYHGRVKALAEAARENGLQF